MNHPGPPGQVLLSIPQFLQQQQGRTSTEHDESDSDAVVKEQSSLQQQLDEGGIGEVDDGKSGKLTLGILLTEQLIEPGEGVLSIDYLGQSFKGDLMSIGKIRSVETGLIFNNPSAWAIYCKKIINPAKKSGCGWASIKYKGRKMDFFKNTWLKRKAERDADTAKNEAAQALTALSAAFGQKQAPPAPSTPTVEEPEVEILSPDPAHRPTIKHTQISHVLSAPRDYNVELESFLMDGRIQPFTVSVSTSAILVLDLHSHMAEEDVCGYLAGYWDSNSHNLAITNTFPCLIDKSMLGTEEARRVESEIYDKLYGNHLSLVGWYHSSPKGPSIPTVKDCFDQLDFQIKLLGNGNETYTPCVGLICSPYEATAKSLESSIVVYWIYPPSESNSQDYGRPMRMSYSAITDPCLSSEVLQQIDKVTTFYTAKPSSVDFGSKYNKDLTYIQKLAKSLVSKFPQDQDDQLWHYIRTQIMGNDEHEIQKPVLDIQKPILTTTEQKMKHQEPVGRVGGGDLLMKVQDHAANHSEEEEIDDDEENALQDDQEEIDDDEDSAIAVSRSYPSNTGTYSPLSFSQVISTSPPRVGHNGELDLRISGSSTAQTITMYSHQESDPTKGGKDKLSKQNNLPQDLSRTTSSQGLNLSTTGSKRSSSPSLPSCAPPIPHSIATPLSTPMSTSASLAHALATARDGALSVSLSTHPGKNKGSKSSLLSSRSSPLNNPFSVGSKSSFLETTGVPMTLGTRSLTSPSVPISNHGTPISQHGMSISQHGTPISQHEAQISNHGTPISQHGTPISQHGTPIRNHGTSITNHGSLTITPTSAPMNFCRKEDEGDSDNDDRPLVIKE